MQKINLKKSRKIIKTFLNFEKTKAVQGIIKKLEIENKEISDPNEINNEINRFKKKTYLKLTLPFFPF